MRSQRATLRLSLACDNHCVFCAQAGLDDSAAPVDAQLSALRAGADEVTFVGGEPLLVPSLAEHVAQARSLGFVRVGVQTNGRHLSAQIAELARRGLTDVHVSLHAASAEAHDYHTGVDGSFVAVKSGLEATRAVGLTVAITTVVTRSNFRILAALPSLLARLGVSAWLLALPRAAGRARRSFDRVMPRLGLALPFALHALDAARRLGVPAFIQGAPLCKLGTLARHSLAEEPRAYGVVCESCAARSECSGVDPLYLTQFGGDELQACSVPPRDEDARARLFVGPGPLALSDEAPPEPARLRLPIAGKVAPALKEVSVAAPRKSGPELRVLFPDLFKPQDER